MKSKDRIIPELHENVTTGLMPKLFVIVEGGCVRYVSSHNTDLDVQVIDLDDMRDLDHPDDIAEQKSRLAEAEARPRIW